MKKLDMLSNDELLKAYNTAEFYLSLIANGESRKSWDKTEKERDLIREEISKRMESYSKGGTDQ